jgi:hypothetical protein
MSKHMMNTRYLNVLLLTGLLAAGTAVAGTPDAPPAGTDLPAGRAPQTAPGESESAPGSTTTPASGPGVTYPGGPGARQQPRPAYAPYWRDAPRYRGYGYGDRRGIGYPGSRGLGGGPYRYHRQFGAPPQFPVRPPPAAPAPADNG